MKKRVEGSFDSSDWEPGLSSDLSASILDVILKWASVDGAVSQLYVAIHGFNDVEHADAASDLPTHQKLRQIVLTARPHAPVVSRAISRLKKKYELYSEVRDTIAHCHCGGRMKSEPERAIFLRYRSTNGGLIVDAIHLDQFNEAARFGEHLCNVVLGLNDRIREAITSD